MWWSRWPDANIGLRTGIVMDVADVDSSAGWHGLRHLLGGAMPAGPQVRTGGGGWHFWFTPTGYGNRVHLLPGVDWRGAGGYVLAPPSRHANDTSYYWVVRPDVAWPSAPESLRGLIAGPDPPFHRRDGGGGRESDHPAFGESDLAFHGQDRSGRWEPGRTEVVHPDRYAAVALEAETDRVARAPVGTRNDTLNRAAFALGRLVGAGLLDAGTVTRELTAAAAWAGLGRAETGRTIRSGLSAGRRTAGPMERRREAETDAGRSTAGRGAERHTAGTAAERRASMGSGLGRAGMTPPEIDQHRVA